MQFTYIDPPFNFNAPDLAKYPSEIVGNYLLHSMARRLNWDGLKGHRLLDFGCGVRFARTIANLDLPLECYAGIDVDAAAIRWLQQHLPEPRFRFAHIDAQNTMYNPQGTPLCKFTTLPFAGERFDAVCMFSVITHQSPEEAGAIFSLIRRSVNVGHLYFTAFIDVDVTDYSERDSVNPRHMSTYSPGLMNKLLTQNGWLVEAQHEPSFAQLTAFVCLPN